MLKTCYFCGAVNKQKGQDDGEELQFLNWSFYVHFFLSQKHILPGP